MSCFTDCTAALRYYELEHLGCCFVIYLQLLCVLKVKMRIDTSDILYLAAELASLNLYYLAIVATLSGDAPFSFSFW